MPVVIERNVNPTEALRRAGRSAEDFRDDVEYLAAHEQELTEKYPDQWVAVFDKQVVAHSRRSRDLVKDLRAKGIPRSMAVVHFLSTKPLNLVL